MKIKVILIDAHEREVTETLMERDVAAMHGLMRCRSFETAFSVKNEDVCFVDEEGRINNTQVGFAFLGASESFYMGSGLMLGCPDEDGNSTNAKSTVAEIRERVTFFTV